MVSRSSNKGFKGQQVLEFYFRKNGKIYCRKKKEKINPPSVIRNIGSSKTGSQELISILGENNFDYPKPSELIKFFVELTTNDGDIILDSFAGSGTTGHAVLKSNSEMAVNRNFILIQMDEYNADGTLNPICETITAERLRRVITGYGDVEGIDGRFDFFELGQPIFLEDGLLNELVGVDKLRAYVYYSETKKPLEEDNNKDNDYYLNKNNDTAYYFYYEQDGPTTLDHDFLATIKTKAEQYVIYADNCLLTKDFMTKHKIIFKKIPRDITKF